MSGPNTVGMSWDQYFSIWNLPGENIDGLRPPVVTGVDLIRQINRSAGHQPGSIDLLSFWGVNIALCFGPAAAWTSPWGRFPTTDQLLRRHLVPLLAPGARIAFVDCNMGNTSIAGYLERFICAGQGVTVREYQGRMTRARANPNVPVHCDILPGSCPQPTRGGTPGQRRGSP